MVLKVVLTDYNIEENQPFDIKIDACELVSLTPSGTLPDTAYIIGANPLVLNLPSYV